MIGPFRGEYGFLSNMPDAKIFFNGRWYRSSECAYQAYKFDYPVSDLVCGKLVLRMTDCPGNVAKKLAKENESYIRPDWLQVRLPAMSEIIHAKFTQHKDLRIQLINTFPHDLVEVNFWHDNFWGDCQCGKKVSCEDKGENWLGRIHMAERMYWFQLMANKSWEGQHIPNDPLAKAA
jgi:N-glycosidase YbiA